MMYSVIVPVYNVEKYIDRCISSVLAQTDTDFELILVDDGSSDKSGDICLKYASNDSRIRYIRTENHGVSHARNTGIENAHGEYIGFVDGDDSIAPDMYEQLISVAKKNNADVVICDSTTVYSDGKTEEDTLPNVDDGELLTKATLTPEKLSYMAGGACRCLYDKTLLDCHNIRFSEGIKLSEDRIFNILAMGYASSVCYTKKMLYFRYVIQSSAVNKYRADYLKTVLQSYEGLNKALKQAAFEKDYFDAYRSNIAYGALSAVYNEFHSDCPHTIKERKQSIKNICSHKTVQEGIPDKCKDIKLRLIKNKQVNLLILMCIVRRLIKR